MGPIFNQGGEINELSALLRAGCSLKAPPCRLHGLHLWRVVQEVGGKLSQGIVPYSSVQSRAPRRGRKGEHHRSDIIVYLDAVARTHAGRLWQQHDKAATPEFYFPKYCVCPPPEMQKKCRRAQHQLGTSPVPWTSKPRNDLDSYFTTTVASSFFCPVMFKQSVLGCMLHMHTIRAYIPQNPGPGYRA